MDLVSPVLRTDFREFCVNYLVLRQIHDIFTMAGVKQGISKTDRPISGQRRTLVEEYYASINWTNEQDVDKFLRVVGYTIAQSYLASVDKKYLQEICEREGFVVDGINIYRKPNQTKPFVMPVKSSDLTKLREDLLIVIDVQVCFWKPMRPAEGPSRFLCSSTQTALRPRWNAWQKRPVLYLLTP